MNYSRNQRYFFDAIEFKRFQRLTSAHVKLSPPL